MVFSSIDASEPKFDLNTRFLVLQQIQDDFWTTWKREYLITLRVRKNSLGTDPKSMLQILFLQKTSWIFPSGKLVCYDVKLSLIDSISWLTSRLCILLPRFYFDIHSDLSDKIGLILHWNFAIQALGIQLFEQLSMPRPLNFTKFSILALTCRHFILKWWQPFCFTRPGMRNHIWNVPIERTREQRHFFKKIDQLVVLCHLWTQEV